MPDGIRIHDIFRSPPPLIFVGAGAAICLGVYLTRINFNLFYLSLVFAVYGITVLAAASTRGRYGVLAALVVLAVWGYAPKKPPYLNVTANQAIRPLAAGAREVIRIPLTDLTVRTRECGALEGRVVMQGRDLGALDITVGGARVGQRKVVAGVLLVSLTAIEAPVLDVAISWDGRGRAGIYQGPEVHGLAIFKDAVYAVFSNPSCRIVYHAAPKPFPPPADGTP